MARRLSLTEVYWSGDYVPRVRMCPPEEVELTSTELLVLLALARLSSHKPTRDAWTCITSLADLSKMTRLSTRSITDRIKSTTEKGYLKTEPRSGHMNTYILLPLRPKAEF